MNELEIRLKGGALIIGSLYWQDDYNSNDKIRKKWRANSLDIKSEILAKLPIRYGRYSNSGIYTMVFSNNCDKRNTLGTGYIIPFKKNPIKKVKTIIREAEKMSEAEGMNKNFISGKKQIWGSMAIIFNSHKRLGKIKNKVLLEWQKKYIDDGGGRDCDDYRFGREKRSLSTKGVLQIRWPEPLNSKDIVNLNELDFLIATITKPESRNRSQNKYPSILEIADSVKKDKSRKYFINNFSNKIITFQDIRIINKIRGEF